MKIKIKPTSRFLPDFSDLAGFIYLGAKPRRGRFFFSATGVLVLVPAAEFAH